MPSPELTVALHRSAAVRHVWVLRVHDGGDAQTLCLYQMDSVGGATPVVESGHAYGLTWSVPGGTTIDMV